MRRSKSTGKEPPGVRELRRIAEDFELSDDAVDDARRLNAELLQATGGVDGYSLLPSQVRLPFDAPQSLKFAIPDAVPTDRQRIATRRRLLGDLNDPRPNVRRAAAFDLGGWSAALDVDHELVDRLAREEDVYVRAVIALAIALRNGTVDVDLVEVARSVIATVARPPRSGLQSLAGSVAVLAATIIECRSESARCHELVAIAQDLALIDTERERSNALLSILSEHC